MIAKKHTSASARYWPSTAASPAALEIRFPNPSTDDWVRLYLSSAGLNWYSSVGLGPEALRGVASDLIELPWPLDVATGDDRYIDEEYGGYLPFFQVNMLLGILANPSLYPGVYLEVKADSQHRERASLWDGTIERFAIDRLHETAPDPLDLLDSALREFASVTAGDTLLPMKWRLERARRALLESVMQLIHRASNLVQIREKLTYPESFDEANEAQLRGYVMLVSGKLPLLHNVAEHMRAARRAIRAASGEKAIGSANDELDESIQATESVIRDWRTAVKSITENVVALEKAMEHAWMERTLYEQEQMRAEQEALAEIERARERTDAVPHTLDSPVFFATLIVSTAALVAGVLSGWGGWWKLLVGLGFAGLFGFGLIAIVRVRRKQQHARGEAARHHYEYNLRFNTVLKKSAVTFLMYDPPLLGYRDLKVERRGAVRVERIDDDEVLYKIHIEATGEVTPRSEGNSRHEISIFTIYELFYHRPTKNAEYLLREVRTIAHAPVALTGEQLQRLTEQIMTELIQPLGIKDLEKRINEGAEPTLVLFDSL